MHRNTIQKTTLLAAVVGALLPFAQAALADEELIETRHTTTIEGQAPAACAPATTSTTTIEKNVVITPSAPPIIEEGTHFAIIDGRRVVLDELSVRRLGIQNKILDRLNAGRISHSQAEQLLQALRKIAVTEEAYRDQTLVGKLSDKEARQLYNAFDAVANRLDSYSHMR